jgi:hypothetical protein
MCNKNSYYVLKYDCSSFAFELRLTAAQPSMDIRLQDKASNIKVCGKPFQFNVHFIRHYKDIYLIQSCLAFQFKQDSYDSFTDVDNLLLVPNGMASCISSIMLAFYRHIIPPSKYQKFSLYMLPVFAVHFES